jgi:hypothetical protein
MIGAHIIGLLWRTFAVIYINNLNERLTHYWILLTPKIMLCYRVFDFFV